MEDRDDYTRCNGWDKDYAEGNKARLGCPAWKAYARWKECFESQRYVWGYCLEDWSVLNPSTGNLEHADLDLLTPSSKDMITVNIQSKKGTKFPLRVNKFKTFHVLAAMIRVRTLKRMARKEQCTITEYAKKMADANDKLDVKFTYGENVLLEQDKILNIGDGDTILQTVKYIGG